MKLLIKNLTGQPVSTPIGTLQPGSSLSHDLPESQLEAVTAELVKLGSRVSYAVGDLAAGRSITSPLTLFVETTGSDSNPGTKGSPFLTIQAALDSLKGVEIAAPVTVQVGAGNFAGFRLEYLSIKERGSFQVRGTFTDSNISGSATVSGIGGTIGHTVITDNTKAWTVNEHRGRLLKYSLNSGASWSYITIGSNTATTLSVPLNAVSGTYMYIIADYSTNINTAIPVLGPVPNGYSDSYTTVSSSACVVFSNCSASHQAQAAQMSVSRLKITAPGASDSAVWYRGYNQVSLDSCLVLRTTGGATLVTQSGAGTLIVSRCALLGNSPIVASIWLNSSSSHSTTSFSGCYFVGSAGSTTAMALYSRVGSNSISGCIFDTCLNGIGIVNDGKASVSQCTFNGCTKGLVVSDASSFIPISAGYFTGCTTAIECGSGSMVSIYPSGSISATTAINCIAGGKVRIGSAITITGTTEISVDGVTTTLAAMRALTPKVFPATPNAYGSYVYE